MLVLTLVICSLLSGAAWFIMIPAFSMVSSALPWFLFIVAFIFSVGLSFYNANNDDSTLLFAIPWSITLFIFVFIVVVALISAPIFNSNPYREAITIEQGNFEDEFEELTAGETYALLDLDTAQRLGDRVLGKVPNATWYNVSQEYNLIKYQGKYYRISPLEYRDLFAYFKAKSSGIPGYVIVDVETKEAKFVQTTDPITVSTSGKFSQNLSRVLRAQFPSYVFDQSFMEIDDDGNPYWVTAVLKANAGLWGARVAQGYVLTNACTRESKYYSIEEEKPEWLDHLYSLDYLMEKAAWHYNLVHGWWNVSHTDVFNTTYSYKRGASSKTGEPAFYGYNTAVSKDGRIKVYTGLTPANNTESNVGFLMVDCVSGEYKYYDIPGAEESSAQSVVEGIIQQMGYESTFPVMVKIAGNPAYLMNLKDKSGLIQRYAIVNYLNYSQAFVGTTFEETLDGYLELIGEKKEEPVIIEEPAEIFEAEGVILEKYQAEVNGTTYFYYVIDDELYKASILINEAQVMFKPGYRVKLSYKTMNGMNVVTQIEKNP